MLRRRRYQVVLRGDAGWAAEQHTVLSEHRSQEEALEVAAFERSRLEVVRAEESRGWRILVMRGDEVVAEERPFFDRAEPVLAAPEPEDAAGEPAEAEEAAPAAETVRAAEDEAVVEEGAPADGEVPVGHEPRAGEAVEAPGDSQGVDEEAALTEDEAEPEAEEEPEEEPVPEGPVPDWIIRRFEDSIARRERREAGED